MKMINLKERKLSKNEHIKNRSFIPGVVYGNNIKSRPVSLSWRDLRKANMADGEVFKTSVEGDEYFVKIQEIQRDPVTREMIHFSLVELPKGHESEIEIPIEFKGTPVGVENGGVFVVLKDEIRVAGTPRKIPTVLKSSVRHMGIGDKLTVSDVHIPKSIKISHDVDETDVIAVCRPPVKVAKKSIPEPEQAL